MAISASGKNTGEEFAAELEAGAVDAVAEPLPGVPAYRDVVTAEHLDGGAEGGEGHHRVGVAVGEQHGRPRADFTGQGLGPDQRPRIADHGGAGRFAAQSDIQRHHGALAETDQGKPIIGQGEAFQTLIEKPIYDQRRLSGGGGDFIRIAVLKAEPLASRRVRIANIGRVGRHEVGVGQNLRPGLGETDEIVAVGAPAMEEDDQPLRGGAIRRRSFGAGDGWKIIHSEFPKGMKYLI